MTTPLNVARCLANTIPEQPTAGQLGWMRSAATCSVSARATRWCSASSGSPAFRAEWHIPQVRLSANRNTRRACTSGGPAGELRYRLAAGGAGVHLGEKFTDP